MDEGIGFGAEGDWKTATLLRVLKAMAVGLPGRHLLHGGLHLRPRAGRREGARRPHARGLSLDRRRSATCEIHPLSIGAREDPVRLVFTAAPGPAINIGLIDLGDRFRLIANEVEVVRPDHALPLLPVARALWEPRPAFASATEAWLIAGGPHHTRPDHRPRDRAADRPRRDRRHRAARDRRAHAHPRVQERAALEPGIPPARRGRLIAHEALTRRVCDANQALVRAGLVALTFGNASEVDRASGVMAIKPSGVAYDELTPEAIVVVSLAGGEIVQGDRRPSSDAPTHLVLYRSFAVDRRHRPHPLAVRHRLGAGPPRHPVPRHDARRPLPRARPGHARPHGRRDRSAVRGANGRCDRRDVRAARHRPGRGSGRARRLTRAVQLGARRRRGGRERDRARDRRRSSRCTRHSSATSPPLPIADTLLERHHARKHGPGAYYGQLPA